MAGCKERSYTNVTAAAFNCLVAKAKENGVTISGDSGTAGAKGIKISWNYNRAAKTLKLTCTAKPVIISCSQVNSRMDEVVNGCKSG